MLDVSDLEKVFQWMEFRLKPIENNVIELHKKFDRMVQWLMISILGPLIVGGVLLVMFKP